MNNTTILYLKDYKIDEEEVMRQAGLKTVRLPANFANSEIQSLATDSPIFVRGPRMRLDEYESLWQEAKVAGVNFLTTPESFRLASNFEFHYPLIRQLSPRALIVDNLMNNSEIFSRLTSENFRFPVFIRSEIESAAKYVGLEGCIMRTPELEQLDLVIRNLRLHVKEFKKIIFKEMLPIATSNIDGANLEYRAIGAKGRLITFDYDARGSKLSSPESFGLEKYAEQALSALAAGGATGAVFVDIAIVEGGSPIVVECKDFVNGSIGYPQKFAEGVLAWQ